MGFNLLIVLSFFLVGSGFIGVSLLVGRFFRPHNPSPDKNEVYECGERPIGEAWMQFNPRFYIIALIFLVFDVEVAFIFSIASVFKEYVALGQGGLVLLELLLFMFLLALGLMYVWKKGDLEWLKRLV